MKILFQGATSLENHFSPQYIIENFYVNYLKTRRNKSIEMLQANDYKIIFWKFDSKNNKSDPQAQLLVHTHGGGWYVFGQVL